MRNHCLLNWVGSGKGGDQCWDPGHLFLADNSPIWVIWTDVFVY